MVEMIFYDIPYVILMNIDEFFKQIINDKKAGQIKLNYSCDCNYIFAVFDIFNSMKILYYKVDVTFSFPKTMFRICRIMNLSTFIKHRSNYPGTS